MKLSVEPQLVQAEHSVEFLENFEHYTAAQRENLRLWRPLGACKGSDTGLFYSDLEEPTREAKAICRGCPVRAECLEYALVCRETEGVWGGMSEKERRRVEKRLRYRSTWSRSAWYNLKKEIDLLLQRHIR